ncbi:tetratricopeptide repeat protein [Flavobacterium sp. DG1-102-2]|uniref:tetratricopeptide repeat protein n=1 Tax=Flavobacterium sp. DG1-102-2 TaxID=3081663 RepID=UPI00294920EC|nr:tetratricopeptide repeat protein [Flavobacterium sp. DG1-102-2]MDV6166837.1 tetratricopeptide repeat protein [Flavobacterium sp. DG1-102-2]
MSFKVKKILIMLSFVMSATLSWSQIQSAAQCDSILKKGQEATRNKEYVKSLELLTTARTAAEKNRWNKQLFYAINYTAHNYIAMMDYGEALNYCLEAYNLSVKELGPEFEMIALNNIAILYTADKNYKKAREYYKKTYETAKNENYKSLGIYLINLANVENILENPEQARAYINEAMPNLTKNWPQSVVAANMILAESDLLEGNTVMARQKAEQLLQQEVKDVAYNDIAVPLKEIIVKSYFEESNYDMAAQTARNILAKERNIETRERIFELLSKIYNKSGKYQLAVACKDSIIDTQHKLNEIKNGRLFENSRVKFEMQDYKNQLALKEEKTAAQRKIIYSLLAIFIAVLTGIVFIFRQKKLIAERNQRITSLELEKEKNDNLLLEKQFRENETNALLEQERLKNEIEARNRKLSAKALFLSDRNQLIEDIITSLAKKPKLSKDVSLANHIRDLKSHLKADDEWEDFITHFEELNQGFLNRLKTQHPGLTSNDIRFIAYIYMNLSIKEISSILNITIEACRKRKDRIAHKMELAENISLYNYISTL